MTCATGGSGDGGVGEGGLQIKNKILRRIRRSLQTFAILVSVVRPSSRAIVTFHFIDGVAVRVWDNASFCPVSIFSGAPFQRGVRTESSLRLARNLCHERITVPNRFMAVIAFAGGNSKMPREFSVTVLDTLGFRHSFAVLGCRGRGCDGGGSCCGGNTHVHVVAYCGSQYV